MTTHALRALAIAACLAITACGSDATDAAVSTTTATDTDTDVEPAETSTTEAADPEPVPEEPAAEDPAPESVSPVEPDDAPLAVDHPLAVSIITEAELAAAFPGEPWTVDASFEPGEDFPPETECGVLLPSLSEHITVFADQASGDRALGQEILTTPSADWVIALRELDACEDVEAVLDIDEYTIIPVTIDGAEDAVAVQVLEEDSEQSHSLVLAVLTPSHTMLISFETVSEDLLDLDALVSVVEQAIARSN